MIDEGGVVNVTHMVFSKAFNRVAHSRLIWKGRIHGIQGELSTSRQNWLEDGKWRVVVVGYSSDWRPV